jgi:hypothetical protein
MEIMVNVKHTNKKSEVSHIRMNLRHYLMAKKVQPNQFEPDDELSKKLIDKVPLEKVPIGTTQADVEAFEKIRGTITGKHSPTDFDAILDAIQKGSEVVDVPQSLNPGQPITFDGVNVTQDDPEIEIDFESHTKTKPNLVHRLEDLKAMDIDKLQAVIDTLNIADNLKEALKKVKKKDELAKQIFLTEGG